MKNQNNRNSIDLASATLILLLIFFSSITSAAPVQSTSPQAMYAYIPNKDGIISILDTTNNTVTATVNVGSNLINEGGLPYGIAVSPDGTKVYVANCGSDSVSVINTTTNTVTTTVYVSGPRSVAVNPTGTMVYVTSSDTNVSVINTETNNVIATVNVGIQLGEITVSPDGAKVYVTGSDFDIVRGYDIFNISVIDTATNNVTATVDVSSMPSGIAVSPDGAKVYVAYFDSDTIAAIDTSTNTITSTIYVPVPNEVAVSPDSSKVYVTSGDLYNGYDVYVIDTATNTVIATINVGNIVQGVAVNPSGTKVFVTNPKSGLVSIIDTTTNRVIDTVSVGNGPFVSGQFIVPPSALKPVLYINFSSNITSGYAPLTVNFTDLSKNAIGWYWEFGDGTISTEQNPTHTYSSAGPYTVKLIANNQNYTDSRFAVITALDQNLTPVANFAANPSRGINPIFVQFTDLSQNAVGWNWNFGDGATSTLRNPKHTFIDIDGSPSGYGVHSDEKSYNVTLTLSNDNATISKNDTIYIDFQYDLGPIPPRGGGGGGGSVGGSPEPSTNIEVKEASQAIVTSGNSANFDFPKNATSVVNVSFDSKKTIGKTTTTIEMLKNKSALTSEVPNGEVYTYFNIWVGNGGFGTSKNIENSVVCFKVEKSWIQDKNIDQSSITLNMYNDKKWDQLSTNLSHEDEKYLYFTAKTYGFSYFAITGKKKVTGTETQLSTENKTQSAVSSLQNKSTNGNTVTNVEQIPKQKQSTNDSGKENTKTPDFEITSGVVCMLCVFLYKRK